MPSQAQNKAQNKWIEKTYDRINLIVPKGQKSVIKTHADNMGESVSAFIFRAIQRQIEADKAKGQE